MCSGFRGVGGITELHGIFLLYSTQFYGSAVFLKCTCYFIRLLIDRTTAVLSKKREEEEKVKEKRNQNTLNGLDGLNMCGSGPFAMYFKYILILPAKPVSLYPLYISHQRLAIAT